MKIKTILDQIDLGSIALPEFQRGYVWNRNQVRSLMHSLYKRYPIGSLLVWLTKSDTAPSRGDGELAPGIVKLLLDGQQRITSLYGIIRGRAPMFFQGNTDTFTGLYFNLEEEIFEFYAPLKMKDNPYWINVTEIMQTGVGASIQKIVAVPEFQSDLNKYINRLTGIDTIKDIDLHVEEVTGEDRTIDVVVEIFNKVNSGGTTLSKGDLALAKVCASWPDARNEMLKRLKKWENAGYYFNLDWLLRCINTYLTGEALFSALKDVNTPAFKKGLDETEKTIDTALDLISSRLGLDHNRVLGSRYSFPLIIRYIQQKGGRLSDFEEQNKLLYWYIHTFLWGRYAGSTETKLSQDLGLIKETDGALERLIEHLRQERANLQMSPDDFKGWGINSRFYPLLYMLTRICHAKDWNTGIELTNHLLGKTSGLELHHIFPKSILNKKGYKKPDVNAIANFTFITKDTNLLISNKKPEVYLPQYKKKQPGALESHWIPMNPKLWKIENYIDFLNARRELLAKAANDFLDSLFRSSIKEVEPVISIYEREKIEVPGGFSSEEEERIITECNEWVISQGLPSGEFLYELVDLDTGEPLAILDIAWPKGLQEGYSQPVAIMLNEEKETLEIASSKGYRYFSDIDSFYEYAIRDILAAG